MYKNNEQNEVPIFYADEPEPEYRGLPKLNENPEIRIQEGNENNEDKGGIMATITGEGSDEEKSKKGCVKESDTANLGLISTESLLKTADNETTIDENDDDHQSDKTIIKGKKVKKTKKKHTLCKLVKKYYPKEHFSDYQALVSNPEYICKKCGRAAKDAASLCKPLPITKQNEETQNS